MSEKSSLEDRFKFEHAVCKNMNDLKLADTISITTMKTKYKKVTVCIDETDKIMKECWLN